MLNWKSYLYNSGALVMIIGIAGSFVINWIRIDKGVYYVRLDNISIFLFILGLILILSSLFFKDNIPQKELKENVK
jgi:heme/copper-type cytochrome/quinol oxidase subunit 1